MHVDYLYKTAVPLQGAAVTAATRGGPGRWRCSAKAVANPVHIPLASNVQSRKLSTRDRSISPLYPSSISVARGSRMMAQPQASSSKLPAQKQVVTLNNDLLVSLTTRPFGLKPAHSDHSATHTGHFQLTSRADSSLPRSSSTR
jgi:hypothetical protein